MPGVLKARQLEAAAPTAFGAEPECAREGEQEAWAAALVVWRPVAQGDGYAEIGLKIIRQKEPHAGSGRCQRQAVAQAVAVVPDCAGVAKGVELIAGPVAEIELLVEAQLERAGKTVVAADLGRAIAPAESRAAEIELLRDEQRPRCRLAGGGELERPGVVEGLVAREPEVQHREVRRGAVARQQIVVEMRGTEDVETLAVGQ